MEVIKTNRDTSWDAIKGVGILLMVVGHSDCPEYLRNFIYLFHMGLFYYASGRFLKVENIGGGGKFIIRKLKSLYLPFLRWGVLFVLLHNMFFSLGWYDNLYDLPTTIRFVFGVIMFGHVESLVIPTWFLASLFKGLMMTYVICCLPRRIMQWCIVIVFYLISCYCDSKGIHLFYSMNRDFGVVIAIYLGYVLKGWNHQVKPYITSMLLILLFVAALYIKIDMVGGVIGPLFAFPLLTLIGIVFMYNCVLLVQNSMPGICNFFTFLGRNSLYVLILHFTSFHVLSHIIVFCDFGHAEELCRMTTLGTINHAVWWVPYTFFGVIIPIGYVLIKSKILSFKRLAIFDMKQ